MSVSDYRFPNGSSLSIQHEDSVIKKIVLMKDDVENSMVSQVIFDSETESTIFNIHLLKGNGDREDTIGYIVNKDGFINRM